MSLVVPDGAPEGCVGTSCGCYVLIDDNIPTNLGAGTDEDRIIVCRPADMVYAQSTPNVVFDESGTATALDVTFACYAYAAFTAGRYPGGVAIISGTGLNAVAT